MDHVPSKSISKSILIVTPLFLIVLSVLHSSSQLSYLFILKFIGNVAGSADITFLPTTQPQVSHAQFNKQTLMSQYNLVSQQFNELKNLKIPLINKTQLNKWAQNKPLIKGVTSRWIIPVKLGNTESILIVCNITNQINIGIIGKDTIPFLDDKQVAIEDMLMSKLSYEIGDIVTVNLQPKNILNGLKLFQKFRGQGSDQQFVPDSASELSQNSLALMFYDIVKPFLNDSLTQKQYKDIFDLLYTSNIDVQYTIKKGFYPQGIYPSALTSVVVMEYSGFTNLISQWLVKTILQLNELKNVDVVSKIPQQYRDFWPKSKLEAQSAAILAKNQISQLFQEWALMSLVRLRSRQKIYYPYQKRQYLDYAYLLQTIPGNYEVIVIYPFFKQSLALKYFFDSVIQIFQFVTCIIYFYTITLIMKQIYQQKQVEVGIWRILGAGGVSRKKQIPYQIQLNQNTVISRGPSVNYSSQFEQEMTLKQKIKLIMNLAKKVGFINYWIAITVLSVLIYSLFKLIFYNFICNKLGFNTIPQPIQNLPIIFIFIFIFLQSIIYLHIQRIYSNSLSETIKPVKRTFDVVKVRIIHVATFGISLQVLLIAVMLVYYGIVSYYWIPFSVLDGQQSLQVLLFNTIFLFMIFGAIILLSILQSRIQMAVFTLIFRCSAQMRNMKSAILKNIKAKQYKNIKVAIIVSIIFAFVLFFTAGIKIQMQIIQSFIQRALGSNLVFQNYQKNTFVNEPINQLLDKKQQIQYSWLSKSLSRDNVSIALLSHISGKVLTPQFQVLTPSYLNSTFYQYYYPQKYLPEYKDYWQLENSIYDGFNSIYTGQNGSESVGKFNPLDTIKLVDPNKVNIVSYSDLINPNQDIEFGLAQSTMAPFQQVINIVVSSSLRKSLGVKVGDFYKMQVRSKYRNISYFLRARITHSFKAGPGFDLLGDKAFISSQQAAYIYNILQVQQKKSQENQKLFIKGTIQNLKGLGSNIVAMSPDHTQMFQIQFVSKSFHLLQSYLNAYIILITCIMSVLVTIFIFLYTLGKCREQAEMYKMLRAIGLSAFHIRLMVFFQIIIRLIVAILDGILLGILFSIGFSLQIQQFLMIKTPMMDITIVVVIGAVLIVVFGLTIVRATKYISQKSVAETNKI